MPRTSIRIWVLATLGVIAATLVACSQESPTAATRPGARNSDVATSTTAAAGSKPATSTYEIKTATISAASGGSAVIEAACSTGKRALGGGFKIYGGMLIAPGDVVVYESTPRVTVAGTEGWRVEAINRSADARDIEAWVICAVM